MVGYLEKGRDPALVGYLGKKKCEPVLVGYLGKGRDPALVGYLGKERDPVLVERKGLDRIRRRV